MSVEENKTTVQRAFEDLFNHGRLAVADEVVSAAFVTHAAPPGTPRGPEGLRELVTLLRTAFPDARIVIEDLIAEGERMCARTTLRGTHRGQFLGIAPTGRRVIQEQMHIVRFVGGKAVEHRSLSDDLGLLRQLGQLGTLSSVDESADV